MKISKLALVALLSVTLSGCFHIQLKGSVGGGSLTIAPLRTPGEIVGSATSGTPQDLFGFWGEEVWTSASAFTKLVFTGIALIESDNIG